MLVLSEFTGADRGAARGAPCNPFDLEGLAGTISLALELDEDDRRRRLEKMAATIRRHDVYAWLDDELAAAAPRARRSVRTALAARAEVSHRTACEAQRLLNSTTRKETTRCRRVE